MPDPDIDKIQMIGINSGKEYPFGALSYLGKDVSIEDIIERMRKNRIELSDEKKYQAILGSYIGALSRFRIGNIVKLHAIKGEDVILAKVADKPHTKRLSKLP